MKSKILNLSKIMQGMVLLAAVFIMTIACGTQAKAATVSSLRAVSDVSGSVFSVKLSWAADSSVNAYEIVRSDTQNGTYTSIAFVPGGETNTYLDTKVADKHTYFYKIRPYQIISWTDVYGEYCSPVSVITSATLPTPKVKIKKKKKTVTITFKSAQGSNYETQYSMNKKKWAASAFKGKLAKSVKKNMTASSKFYLRVRTKKKITINGKSQYIYSGWSKASTVK